VAGGFDFGPDFLNLAVGSDEEGGAFDAHILLAVHTLFDPDAIGLGGGMVRVGEKGEGEIELMQQDGSGLVKSEVTKRTRE